jgi:hypothetical protein
MSKLGPSFCRMNTHTEGVREQREESVPNRDEEENRENNV